MNPYPLLYPLFKTLRPTIGNPRFIHLLLILAILRKSGPADAMKRSSGYMYATFQVAKRPMEH